MKAVVCACLTVILAGLLFGQSNVAPVIYKIGDRGVRPPRPIFSPPPEYPKEALKKKIEGTVTIDGYVGEDGRYHDAKIVHPSNPDLDAKAIEGVKTWKFTPCTKDGVAVKCYVRLEVSFRPYAPPPCHFPDYPPDCREP